MSDFTEQDLSVTSAPALSPDTPTGSDNPLATDEGYEEWLKNLNEDATAERLALYQSFATMGSDFVQEEHA